MKMSSNLLPLGFAAWLIILILQSSIAYASDEKEGPPQENGVDTKSDSQSSKEPGKPPPLPKDPRYLAVVYAALNNVKEKSPAAWERIKSNLPDWLKVPEAITNMFHKLGSFWGHKPSPEPPVSSDSGSPYNQSKEEDISIQESSVVQHKPEASSQQEQAPESAQLTESPSETVNSAQPSAQEPPPPAYEPSPSCEEPAEATANEPSKPAKEPPPSDNEPSSPPKESPPPANEPSSPPKEPSPPANEPSSPPKEPPAPAKEPTSPPKESPPPANKAPPPAKESSPASDSSTPIATPPPKTGGGFRLSSDWRTPSPVNNQSPPPSPPSPLPHSSHDYSSYSLSSFEKPSYGSSAYDDYKRTSDYLEYLKKIVNEP